MARQRKQRNSTNITSFRLTDNIRKELEAATDKAGTSQTTEILNRLAASFFRDRAAAKGHHIHGLAQAVSALAEQIEAKTGAHWNKDATTLEQLCAGLPKLLRETLAKVAPLAPDKVKEAQRAGEQEANMLGSQLNTLMALPMGVVMDLYHTTTSKLLTGGWPAEYRFYDIVFSLKQEQV
jgi:hypothetical protein